MGKSTAHVPKTAEEARAAEDGRFLRGLAAGLREPVFTREDVRVLRELEVGDAGYDLGWYQDQVRSLADRIEALLDETEA